MDLHSDERGVILNWLAKLALVLAIFGTILFDVATIAVNVFGLDSLADDIAVTLSTIEGANPGRPVVLDCIRDAGRANHPFCQEAARLAAEAEAQLVRAEITVDGIMHIGLRRKAKTLIAHRLGFLDDVVTARADGQAGVT